MTLIGLDLNASRARAAHGPASAAPYPLALEGPDPELPLAVSLEGKAPVPGRAGLALCRRTPHLACLDFLPHLGAAKHWSAGRVHLDAAGALACVFDHLARCFGRPSGLALALPPYLNPDQEAVVAQLANQARWRILRLAPTPLLLALAGRQHLPLSGTALLLDADGHALTWAAAAVERDHARLLSFHTVTRLGGAVWLNRLVEQASNRCILLSRRDPRESPDAEQDLHDQLRQLLTEGMPELRVDVSLQAANWSQHLMFHPDELSAFCAPLAQNAVAQLQAFLPAAAPGGPIGAVLVTHAAACLPGLVRAVEAALPELLPSSGSPDAGRSPGVDVTDFGENLLIDELASVPAVQVLDPDAAAFGAHELASRAWGGELEHVPYGVLPLPDRAGSAGDEAEAGPARLEFRGQEHILSGPTFTLGRDPARCNLVFESELYPTVSGRHCEIVFDSQRYTLRDLSRHGTLVNDQPVSQPVTLRPGDWIRLGPVGPVVRFLGSGAGGPHYPGQAPYG
jgi:hypothetical protein